MIDLTLDCTDCHEFVEKWATWWEGLRQPVALLNLHDDYWYNTLDTKSRNMVRKAQRYYKFRAFSYNVYLDDMFEINTSKPVRSGGPMLPSYLEKPRPITSRVDECPQHRVVYYGGFDNNKLMAYCWLVKCGQLGVFNKIIGHAEALPNGIMNGMIHGLVTNSSMVFGLKYICYLNVDEYAGGLDRFKRSVGFKSVQEAITW